MENDKIDTELIQQVAQTKEWSKGAERRIQKMYTVTITKHLKN